MSKRDYPIALFLFFIFLIIAILALTRAAFSQSVSQNRALEVTFQHDGKDNLGNLETFGGFVIAERGIEGDSVLKTIDLPGQQFPDGYSSGEVNIDIDLSGEQDSITIVVKAFDLAGNESAWTEPATIQIDRVLPTKPINIQLKWITNIKVSQ